MLNFADELYNDTNMVKNVILRLGVTLCAVVSFTLTAVAQTAREEIKANKYLAGSNYLDYDRQLPTKQLTPAPKGYKPFYLSHYGRHGSRWLIAEDSYTSVLEPLQKARTAGKLTDKGEEVLTLISSFAEQPVPDFPALNGQWQGAQPRLGDLSTVGERQHHGIGQRLVQHFPEIFKAKNVNIDARSTVVRRCILSMIAECEELAAANPTARIHNDASEALQYYMNQPRSGLVEAGGRKGREMRKQLSRHITTDRLMTVLFNDQKWVKENIKAEPLMYNLFEVTTNMQSHDGAPDLYSLFTEEEIYEQWRLGNIGWYLDYGAAPQTGGVMPFSQRNLLRNIIETTDTVTQTQATLRFGHEVCVLPLACLLELGSCGAVVDDLDQLDAVWRNYRIFPMGCNIQLVFYRKAQNSKLKTQNPDDILVKALLNEREVTLPVQTTQYPYYRWSDLRKYYLDKLAAYDAKEAAMLKKDEPEPKYKKYYAGLPVEVKPVKRPVFPNNEVNLKDVGGVGDGITLNTEAIAKGISKLSKQGGGRLTIPEGVWLTGPIMLKDNIELHLQKNAIVLFSSDKTLYKDKNPKAQRALACIRASKRKNIAVTGSGIIDGNGAYWRPVKRGKVSDVEWSQYQRVVGGVERDKGKLFYPWSKNVDDNIAATPEEQDKMRNDLIRLTDCENVLIEGVTVQNAPKFHVHPLNCRNVIVDGVTVRCPWNAQNGDAIDFSDVNVGLIVDCTVDAGDDGICMKSGMMKPKSPANGCEDIVIQDNTVFHAHGGFVLGSETVSGIRRIVVRHNRFSGTDTGLRFKSGIGRGGKTEQLYISDIVMTDIKDQAIVFQCDYVDRPAGSDPNKVPEYTEEQKRLAPDFQDIHISNVTCHGTHTGIKASGILGLDCVHDIDIKNTTIIYHKVGQQIDETSAKLQLENVKLLKMKNEE